MSNQVFWPSTMLLIAAHIVDSSDLTCFVLSRSRRVNVLSFTDWKSTVMPSGVPSSSFLEYLLPMLAEESSTRFEMFICRSFWPMRWIRGLKSGWLESGTRRTLVGATGGGKDRT